MTLKSAEIVSIISILGAEWQENVANISDNIVYFVTEISIGSTPKFTLTGCHFRGSIKNYK